MDRKVIPYQREHKQACIKVFRSNIGKYFAEEELAEFEDFLDTKEQTLKYFVMISADKVIGCGGYYVRGDEVRLIDGMIDQSEHKTGAGVQLLEFRLNAAKLEYPNKDIAIDTSQHTEGFFKKYGFTTTDVVNNFFGEGIDKVSMVYQH